MIGNSFQKAILLNMTGHVLHSIKPLTSKNNENGIVS